MIAFHQDRLSAPALVVEPYGERIIFNGVKMVGRGGGE
jgi:hypothetical protein